MKITSLAVSAVMLAAALVAPPSTAHAAQPHAKSSGGGGAGASLPAAIASTPDFRAIVQSGKDRVFPAVVYIRCVRDYNDQGKAERAEVSGSGVIISPEGEALTNWHVIDKASSVRVLLTDGRHYDAKVVGSDKDTDVALIKMDMPAGTTVPYAALGPSAPIREGDFVMAMGAPYGLNRSVSIGIASCTIRYLAGISEYSLWIQTDAPINPGNSGGPLVNTDGQVIGLNARGMNWAEGMGFAIPSDTINVLVPQLRKYGHVNWAWFGLQLQPIRDFDKDMYFDGDSGVMVAETDADSPARRAGVLAKDRIVAVNGKPVTVLVREDLPAFNRQLGLLEHNAPVKFDIQRDDAGGGAPQKLTIELTPREKGKTEGEELALDRFDFTVKAINQFDNPDLYFHRKQGVFIHATRWPGNAGNSGLRTRDIIVKIGDRDINTVEDVKAAHKTLTADIDKEHRVVVTILRGGLQRTVVLDYLRDFTKE